MEYTSEITVFNDPLSPVITATDYESSSLQPEKRDFLFLLEDEAVTDTFWRDVAKDMRSLPMLLDDLPPLSNSLGDFLREEANYKTVPGISQQDSIPRTVPSSAPEFKLEQPEQQAQQAAPKATKSGKPKRKAAPAKRRRTPDKGESVETALNKGENSSTTAKSYPKAAKPRLKRKNTRPTAREAPLLDTKVLSTDFVVETREEREEALQENLIPDNSVLHQKEKFWIPLERLSIERAEQIKSLAVDKRLPKELVDRSLQLFSSQNILIKLQILSHPQLLGNSELFEQDDETGMCCRDHEGVLFVEGKTYAGNEPAISYQNTIMGCFSHLAEIGIYYKLPKAATTSSPKTRVNLKSFLNKERAYPTRAATKQPKRQVEIPKRILNSTTIDLKYIKRPLNSFMLYRATMIRAFALLTLAGSLDTFIASKFNMPTDLLEYMQQYDPHQELEYLKVVKSSVSKSDPEVIERIRASLQVPKLNHTMSVHVISLMWHTESDAAKARFSDLSNVEKQLHAKCFPNYRYNPRKKKV